MAEERTLGLARAQEQTGEEPSKQELQRRLDEARDSISHTVTEIKESVASQVQAVKETLDWREQVKKRPVAWSAGAAGVGFLVGYGLAAMVRGGDGEEYSSSYDRYYAAEQRSYAAQPILQAGGSQAESIKQGNGKHDEGPGFLEKLTSTPAYHKVKEEASNLGDAFVQEISKTAKQLVLPAIMTSLRNFIGGYLPKADTEQNRSRAATPSTYQPTLEPSQR
jgi:ElaB/YqjD/DUF883 family membrane-anchored ribosome-binding protein